MTKNPSDDQNVTPDYVSAPAPWKVWRHDPNDTPADLCLFCGLPPKYDHRECALYLPGGTLSSIEAEDLDDEQ